MKFPSLFLTRMSVLCLLIGGCSQPVTPAPPPGVEIPEGYSITRLPLQLKGPTQMVVGPEGRYWIAHLNGPENAGTGQVLRYDPIADEREVLLEGLEKPTGLAILAGWLWIAAGQDLLRATLENPSTVEVVLEDLPFNGRSNGTLTVTPKGELLYETSGRRVNGQAAQGSAGLWLLDPYQPVSPRLLATGLKGAYAQTFDEGGRLWVSEISDDRVNGRAPPDELNLIFPGADYGWPKCFGLQEPAFNYGGTEAGCQRTEPSIALFPEHSTPTSIVESPFEPGALLVALWSAGEVVRVALDLEGGKGTAEVGTFIAGLPHPQHLLTLPDGSLLVSDFQLGRLFQVQADS